MSNKPAEANRRGFALHIEPDDANATFNLRLIETNGSPDHQRPVGYLSAERFGKVSDIVADAVKASGIKPSVLNPTRRRPIELAEVHGVRLSLLLNVIDRVTKPGRTRALIDGLNRLSDEECLYWYAATTPDTPQGHRRLRALRLYLADD